MILIHTQKGKKFIFGEKIKPVPISTAWKNRLGEYVIVNLNNDGITENAVLREQDGILMLEYSIPNNIAIPIEPISETEAIILGMGRDKRENIRIIKLNGKEHIAYSGYLLKKK